MDYNLLVFCGNRVVAKFQGPKEEIEALRVSGHFCYPDHEFSMIARGPGKAKKGVKEWMWAGGKCNGWIDKYNC